MREQMSKGITVKLPTHKVIAALETKLAVIKKDYANQESYEDKYQKAYAIWQKELTNFAIANVKKATNFRTNYRSWNSTLNIDYDVMVDEKDLPVCPEREFESMSQHTYRETVEEITNALSILRMTDEPTVNASTMKQIAKYL
jgi:hypothetical protein